MTWLRSHSDEALLALILGLLAAGLVAMAADADTASRACWLVATLIGLVASLVWMVQSMRAGEFGVDIVAILALGGSLLVDEMLAGAIIALMLTGGRMLESRAEARAHRELSQLVSRAPRHARIEQDGTIVKADVGEVRHGDRIVVGTGEVVPVDGRLVEPAVLDESMLTGEALPVPRTPGDQARSGTVNTGSPTRMVATATSEESTYTAIVRLVEQAHASSAPFVRVADRAAIVFVPLALLLAGAAWLVSGDPVRAVAVLVVATPCPLLLAAPIAVISGVSRAAKAGVIMKGGRPLEQLAAVRVLLFDKTGTLTRGEPILTEVVADPDGPDPDEILALAASLDQVSGHVLAGAVVRGARARGLDLTPPTDVVEQAGGGIAGLVGDVPVRAGTLAWAHEEDTPAWTSRVRRRSAVDGSATVFVSADDRLVGALVLNDELRPDANRMIRDLRDAGITRTVLVTGDRADVAESVGRLVGIHTVHAECDPREKVDVVREERAHGSTAMCGDGVNDAPALAAADVGVALAAHGTSASAEAADVVLTTDRLGALADAMTISRRSRRIAAQAVGLGMGLSLVAMGLAAVGLLRPTAGALLQEGIDLLAILLALRAALPGRRERSRIAEADLRVAARLAAEHDLARTIAEDVRHIADDLTGPDAALTPVHDLAKRLEAQLVPHIEAEEAELVPLVERLYGQPDPIAGLSRTHAEIRHQVGRLHRILDSVDLTGAEAGDIVDIRQVLYSLYGVLRLHNAQEEESIYSLLPIAPAAQARARDR